ncbi:hypothetical protein BKI52_31395 [marine bacterium AO1-C]|nr:hypothetical protein BKI52_31395 [marine bacterium AO1-C]
MYWIKFFFSRLLITSLFFLTNCIDKTSIRIDLISNREKSNMLALSNDKKRIIIVSQNGNVRIWDLSSGKMIKKTKLDIECLLNFEVSPDNTKMLTKSCYSVVKLWDINNGNCLKTFKSFSTHWIRSDYKFSPNGSKILLGSIDRGTYLWNINTGKFGQGFSPQKGIGIGFSQNDLKLLTLGYDTLNVWNVKQNKYEMYFQLYNTNINSVIFSPDSKKILTGGNKSDPVVKLWNLKTRKLLKSFEGFDERIFALSFSEDGSKVLAGSGFIDNEVKVWDIQTEKNLLTLRGHEWDITFATYLNKKIIITGDYTATVKLWDAQNGQLICNLYFDFESENAWAITTPDGRYDANKSGLRYLFYLRGNKRITPPQNDPNFVKGLFQEIMKNYSASARVPTRDLVK